MQAGVDNGQSTFRKNNIIDSGGKQNTTVVVF